MIFKGTLRIIVGKCFYKQTLNQFVNKQPLCLLVIIYVLV